MSNLDLWILINLTVTCIAVLLLLCQFMRAEIWKSRSIQLLGELSIVRDGALGCLHCDFDTEETEEFEVLDDDAPVSFSQFKRIAAQRQYGKVEDQQ